MTQPTFHVILRSTERGTPTASPARYMATSGPWTERSSDEIAVEVEHISLGSRIGEVCSHFSTDPGIGTKTKHEQKSSTHIASM